MQGPMAHGKETGRIDRQYILRGGLLSDLANVIGKDSAKKLPSKF